MYNSPPQQDDELSEILFQDFLERKKEERAWYRNLPTKLIAVLGIIGILILVVFVEQLADYRWFIITGGMALLVILVSLGRQLKGADYLSEPEAMKIMNEYLMYKKELVPELMGKRVKLTGPCLLQEWDTGQGMQPWKYLIPYDSFDADGRRTRWLGMVDPYSGKVIGTELLDKTDKGRSRPHLKIMARLFDRFQQQFKYDTKSGRSKWT